MSKPVAAPQRPQRQPAGVRWLALLLGCALFAVASVRAETDAEWQKFWTAPEFRKQFLGSYGIHPDVEPRVAPEERATLEKIYPLLATDPAGAAKLLETAATSEATALFDFILGNLAFQDDRDADAIARFETAVRKHPAFRRAWKNLGLAFMKDGQSEKAIPAFTRMLELGGADALSYGLLGSAYSAKLDFLAAETAYRYALLLDPANLDWRMGLVRSVVKQEKYEEASGLLRGLLERNPEKAEFWVLQANAYLGMGQPLRAAENLEVVARLGRGTPETLNLLGDIYVNEQRPDVAADAYVRAIEADPAQPPAKALRAVDSLATRGFTAEAQRVAVQARATFGESLTPEDLRRLMKLQARIDAAEGRNDAAAVTLEEIVALDPLDGDALILLGQHYAKAGDPEKAIVYFERAMGLDAFEAQAKARMAQVLVSQGKYDEALPLLRRARELKPSDELTLYLEQVERLARARS